MIPAHSGQTSATTTVPDSGRYYLCLLGPLALSLAVGVQFMMAALLILGPSKGPLPGDLTLLGRFLARPEHDLAIYVLGVVLVFGFIVLAVRGWRAGLARAAAQGLPDFMTSSAVTLGLFAGISLLVFVIMLSSYWFQHDFRMESSVIPKSGPLVDRLRLAVPGLMALLCAGTDLKLRLRPPGRRATFHVAGWLPWGRAWLAYAVPGFILLILAVPPGAAKFVAGQIFLRDGCHHLNYFFMGPALSFAHGKAFGTEIYSQYGIGWPLIASMLSRFSTITYGNLVALEVAYSCVYYITLFFLLRAGFKQNTWAATAVVLLIYLEMFGGLKTDEVTWLFPSATPLRHPVDVFFFFVLIIHQRSGQIVWIALAGVLCGLAIFFETESGLLLTGTFYLYVILGPGKRWRGASSLPENATEPAFVAPRTVAQHPPLGAKVALLQLLVATAACILTLLAFLLYASRGTILSARFWHGWLEPLVAFGGSGVTAMPIAELPDISQIWFVLMVLVELATISYGALRALHRTATEEELLLAAVAAYGLASLLVFVNRSHPFNLLHQPMVSFVIVIFALVSYGWKHRPTALRDSLLPWTALGTAVLLLLTKPEFRRQENIVTSLFADPPTGLSLISDPEDISGLPPDTGGFVEEFRSVVEALRELSPQDSKIAVLSFNDTVFYAALKQAPWSRYTSIFPSALSTSYIHALENELIGNPPAYVVVRRAGAPKDAEWGEWDFIRDPLYQIVTNRFELRKSVGSYQIWSPANSARAHCLAAELMMSKGQAAQAIVEYDEALKVDPNFTDALNNLAWIRSTAAPDQLRDGAQAVRLGERACQITGYRQALLMGTLAAAYAEAGRFEEAVTMAKRARETALAAGETELAGKNQELIKLFEARQPYRESVR